MNPRIKITRELLEKALHDLERPHPFAFERVGFFSCRQLSHNEAPILLCYDYHSVDDADYLESDEVGALINGNAIRAAMGRTREHNSAQLWVHTHGRKSSTFPSQTDYIGGADVLRSLVNAKSDRNHGWIVISESTASGQIHLPNKGTAEISDLTIVGAQLAFSPSGASRNQDYQRELEAESRQGFLGEHLPRILAQARIGLVGYGGGGSHIGQQLAHIGFENVRVFDHDTFEGTNLTRLVGSTEQDIQNATPKVEIAQRVYEGIRPDANFQGFRNKWQERQFELSECDIIFSCVDRFDRKRELEYFCRSRMIPMIDIGMKVIQSENAYPAIYGQIALSMPNGPCLRCLNVTSEKNLANEANDYGAGPQPQVVWPNGVLASTAVGMAVQLLTGWNGPTAPPLRLDYSGNDGRLEKSGILEVLKTNNCRHFTADDLGDPSFVTL